MAHRVRAFLIPAIVLGLLATAGCGSKGGAKIAGVVTYQGKPLASGTVHFVYSEENIHSGTIGPDGHYEIAAADVGKAKIAVESPKPPLIDKKYMKRGEVIDASKFPDPAKWFAIPDKYANPATSGKEADVSSGSNTIPIALD